MLISPRIFAHRPIPFPAPAGLYLFVTNFSSTVENVSGPVAILAAGAEVARSSTSGLYQFAALININLAVVNILPLPALDGGYRLRGRRCGVWGQCGVLPCACRGKLCRACRFQVEQGARSERGGGPLDWLPSPPPVPAAASAVPHLPLPSHSSPAGARLATWPPPPRPLACPGQAALWRCWAWSARRAGRWIGTWRS